MKPEDFSEAAVRRLCDDALKRAETWTGQRAGIGTIIHYAKEGGYRPQASNDNDAVQGSPSPPFDLDAAIPRYSALGMPPREFAGPWLGDAYLFPMNALSLFVALGGRRQDDDDHEDRGTHRRGQAVVELAAAQKAQGADLLHRGEPRRTQS